MVLGWLFGCLVGSSALPPDSPWADGPFALIPANETDADKGLSDGSLFVAQDMTIIHNIIIRAMNSIYLQARNVSARGTAQDAADFAEYAACWAAVVDEHHRQEEAVIFPAIERLAGAPRLMQPNVDQHDAFHPGLAAFAAYLADVRCGSAPYDGARLVQIVDGFMPVLTQHLHDEIGTLKALGAYEDRADWKKWLRGVVAEIFSKSTTVPSWKYKAMPFLLVNHDGTFDDGAFAQWPPLPWHVRLLFRFWYVPVNKRMWRFASVTAAGAPRALPFAEKKTE